MARSQASLRKQSRADWVDVGARARQIREALGLTQPQFVDLLRERTPIRTSVPELSRIETGASELPRHWMLHFIKLDPLGRHPTWLAFPSYNADGDSPPESTEAAMP